jgi:hypothetical protein
MNPSSSIQRDQVQVDATVYCCRLTVFANSSLLIHNVKASDEGFYSCVGIPVDVNQVPQTYTAELNIACELCMHVLNQSVNRQTTLYSVVNNKEQETVHGIFLSTFTLRQIVACRGWPLCSNTHSDVYSLKWHKMQCVLLILPTYSRLILQYA